MEAPPRLNELPTVASPPTDHVLLFSKERPQRSRRDNCQALQTQNSLEVPQNVLNNILEMAKVL